MISNTVESFLNWCHLNSISSVIKVIYSHFSFLGFLMNFRDFWVFVFGYRPQNENPEITENLYFWVCKVEMDMDPFLYLYFNFLSVKTEIKKNYNKRLNFINLEGSKALKRQIAATWSAMQLNHFEMMSFEQYFKGFWSYILTFQFFGVFDEFPWFLSFRFWL